MRIIVSDYSGHPFQVQLSRALARIGHEVLHLYSASFQTPKGNLLRRDDDVPGFQIKGIFSTDEFQKDSFVKRRRQEIEIGERIGAEIKAFKPDVVFSGNAPIDTQVRIRRAARQVQAKFVFWVQDLYGEAIRRILHKKFGAIGSLIGGWYSRIERRLIRSSHHVVAISEEFRSFIADQTGVAVVNITVVENWAPLEEVSVGQRDNEWARSNLPSNTIRFVYSGTLGFKHDPSLLLKLAREISGDVMVFSEGRAAETLARDAAKAGVRNLHVRNWLPFSELPHALAGGDVLIVILEPDAGAFSVPSKVLTYLCAGRPILGSVPANNLAARIITGANAGIVAEPGDYEALIGAAVTLEADAALRRQMGLSARAYAEKTFDIDAIVSRFAAIATCVARPQQEEK